MFRFHAHLARQLNLKYSHALNRNRFDRAQHTSYDAHGTRKTAAHPMLSIPHMIVVFIIVLVVFGPNKLPELARGLGKLMAEFRKASTDFKSAFEAGNAGYRAANDAGGAQKGR